MKSITITALALALMLCAGCVTKVVDSQDALPTARCESGFWRVDDAPEPQGAVRIVAEIEQREAEAAEEAAQEQEEAEWDGYCEEYYEEAYYDQTYYGGNDYGNSFKQEGVAYDENYEYTWYSQNVLNGSGLDELNANGRHVDEDTGFIVDGDGYIAVAMNGVDQGTVIDTKWGQAKVYDTKDDDAPYDGTVDIYTDF